MESFSKKAQFLKKKKKTLMTGFVVQGHNSVDTFEK